jgi:chitodextrinase
MTFSISSGETIYNPGSVTLCMFADMGWVVNQDCQGDAINGLTATNDGPTLLGSATQLIASISGGSSVSYSWDFGDGSSGTGAVITHQYAAPGSYTATVTASNTFGQETAETNVKVQEGSHQLLIPLLAASP